MDVNGSNRELTGNQFDDELSLRNGSKFLYILLLKEVFFFFWYKKTQKER